MKTLDALVLFMSFSAGLPTTTSPFGMWDFLGGGSHCDPIELFPSYRHQDKTPTHEKYPAKKKRESSLSHGFSGLGIGVVLGYILSWAIPANNEGQVSPTTQNHDNTARNSPSACTYAPNITPSNTSTLRKEKRNTEGQNPYSPSSALTYTGF